MNGVYKYGDSGKTVVFLPGGGVDIKCYVPLIQELAKVDTIYAVNFCDMRTTSFRETVDQVKQLVASLNDNKVILIGHSFGADIANVVATEMEVVSKAILASPKMIAIPDSKLLIILKLIWKTIIGPIKYPLSLPYHATLANFVLSNFFVSKESVHLHNKQALEHVRDAQFVVTKNSKNVLFCSTDDILYPLEKIPKEVRTSAIIVEGHHDWIMNDIDVSVATLRHIMVQ